MRKTGLVKRKKFRSRVLGLLAVTALLAAGLTGCGDETKDKTTTEQSKDSAQDQEEEEFVYEERDGGIYLIKYNGSDSDVEIPEEYNNEMVYGVADTAFSDYAQIKSITIPYTVQNIDSDMLPEECDIKLKVYENSAGMIYAVSRGLQVEYLGENPAQASSVLIYDLEGKNYVKLTPGKTPEEEWLQGVAFDTVDGKSVLTLDNCEIGSVVVEEYAALSIRLEQGSTNKVTGQRGNDGINVNGALEIAGAGSLDVIGSELYSVGEGDWAYVGCGIAVLGDFSVSEHAQLTVKAGTSSSRSSEGILVKNGNLTVADSRIEIYGGQDELLNSAAVLMYQYTDSESGKLNLENTRIVTGGQQVSVVDEETQEAYATTIGSGVPVIYDEFAGFENASSYVVIEP